MEVLGQQRDQIPEHVARGGKAVQQQDGGLGRIAGPAMEDAEITYARGVIADGGREHARNGNGLCRPG